jgi:predicted GNAT superfamily acetyltransferase
VPRAHEIQPSSVPSSGSTSASGDDTADGARREVPGEVIDEATATAHAAAEKASVVLDDIHDHHGADEASQLFDRVWQRAQGSVLSQEALIAISHAGGQVTLASREGRVVGATAALLGRDHRSGQRFLHSHVTGVHADEVGTGIGRALKWYQRLWCMERGIDEVRWTFDPLVRRNAVLNLVLLGARATAYELDVYGPMDDQRNAGLPTDRLVASWELSAPRTQAAAKGRAAAPDVDALVRAGAEPLLVAEDDEPQVRSTSVARRLVQVPADIESIRARDRDLGAAWANAVRATLGAAMREGARVTGITRDGWYVLAPPAGVSELADVR